MKFKWKKFLVLFTILGFGYLNVETTFTAFSGKAQTLHIEESWFSLKGTVSLWMFLIGGASAYFLGLLNQWNPIRRTFNVFFQSVLGALIVLAVELLTGLFFNRVLRLDLWSYEDLPCDLMGQICLLFGGLWFLICPLAFWFDDLIRYRLYGEGNQYGLWEVYKKLFAVTSKPQFQHQL